MSGTESTDSHLTRRSLSESDKTTLAELADLLREAQFENEGTYEVCKDAKVINKLMQTQEMDISKEV